MDELYKYRLNRLRTFCQKRFPKELGDEHGPSHWDRVAMFGHFIATDETDLEVVDAFALLHDVERKDNDLDPLHGDRSAALVETIRDSHLAYLNDVQIEMLKMACMLHNNTVRTSDNTVNTCFDADRLDLPRAGIRPDPARMATENGIKMVSGAWSEARHHPLDENACKVPKNEEKTYKVHLALFLNHINFYLIKL